METQEYNQKKQQIEDEYYQEKRDIQRQQEQVDTKVLQFRRETNQLVDKVLAYTKIDTWNKQSFYRNMQGSDEAIQQEGRRYSQYLEERHQEITKQYQKDLNKLDERKRIEGGK